MAERTEKEEQVTPGNELLHKRLKVLQGMLFDFGDTIKDLFVYMETIADDKHKYEVELLRNIYEAKLAERYNTKELQNHRGNTLIHYSDKNTNTYTIEDGEKNEHKSV